MGGLLVYYLNLARATWRLLLAPLAPWSLPRRADQWLAALGGLDYRVTLSRWAGQNAGMLYTWPIRVVTDPFDADHVDEAAGPYPPGPGFRYFPVGLATVGFLLYLAGCGR